MNLGKKLGNGKSRDVYVHPDDESLVIKVLKNTNRPDLKVQNKNEWEIWDMIKGTKYEKYFCPCIEISDCGKYLTAKRAQRAKHPVKFPKELQCDGDIKWKQNSGIYNDNTVIIDYGHPKLFNHIKKLKLN